MTYWNETGTYQTTADALNALVPASGPVSDPSKNKALEKFRKASNLYYEIFNNGCCNTTRGARELFGIDGYSLRSMASDQQWEEIHSRVEPAMDRIITEAAAEQGLALL